MSLNLRKVWRNLTRSWMSVTLLIVSCIGLAYVGFSLWIQTRLPTDGTLWTESSPSGISIANVVVPVPGGLQTGDQILAIDGRTIWEWSQAALSGRGTSYWRIGQTVTYRLRRNGQMIDLPVTLMPFSLARVSLLRTGVYALILLALVIGGYVMLAQPNNTAARILFLIGICLLFTLSLHVQVAILVTPALFVVENALKFLSRSMLFSGFLQLFLVFPVTKPRLRGKEKWLRLLYILPPFISVLIGLIFGETPSRALTLAWQSISLLGLVMLILGIASVIHTYITVRNTTARSQIRWIAWGCIVGLLPYILFTALPEVLAGRGLLMVEVTSFFVIALPVSIAISIARYRLFYIDTVIRHSVLYTLFTILLAIVYIVLVALLNQAVLQMTGQSHNTIVVFISTFVVTTAFWALRSRVTQLVFQLFNRGRVPPNKLLAEMSERLARTIRVAEIETLLTQTIPEKLESRRGYLQIPGQGKFLLDTEAGKTRLSSLQEVWDAWREHGAQPVFRSTLPSWFPKMAFENALSSGTVSGVPDTAASNRIELVLPLVAGDQLVGLWGLEPRSSKRPFSGEQVRVLNTLGRQVAVSVQNAHLVSQLEAQSQWLAEQVRHRTQDLEGERNRLTIILQNMADGLLVTDVDKRVLLTNAAFEHMVHSETDILVGQPLNWTVNCPALVELVARSAQTPGKVISDTFELNELVLYASAFALPDRSNVITVLRDVTHQVEVDRVKSEFISSISHELRTPLTSVLGFSRLVSRAWERTILSVLPDDDRTQKTVQRINQNLGIIVSEGTRLTRLIDDILDIADMQDSKLAWRDRSLSIQNLVQHSMQIWHERAKEKGLALSNQVEANLPPFVADPDRIQQVLSNLVSNAIKFTEQGRVTIAARMLSPGTGDRAYPAVGDWHPPDPTMRLLLVTVSDTGPGIAEKDLPRLFSRFQQLSSNVLTDKPRGTGLGLAICKEIIGHYGGTIWAESVVGHGSTFSFVLPVKQKP
ncbi:MAG: hypothetical protein JXA89_16475 [Anaerolineae bacterium]|nr:hypothetical protein [Anaerolineae bacterium]